MRLAYADLKAERDELAGRIVAERDAHLQQEEETKKVLDEIKAECIMWREGTGEPSEVLDEIAKLVGCPELEQ